ncbi:sulfotransferase family 2 domain-containing protein [Alteromonas sp. 14N.309.X.WAT.G.H12]|uniref:sulfotransferase family 2 domain-containing protein n=1 Tax=Alteromonas sp. 14N.309.X.WAT.G.H12 TaxID=3120824 RepID=UPI002FD3A36E
MIVSDEKEFVFIHNPKCGGTTVRDSLKKFDTHAHWFWGQTKINGLTVDKAHMPLSIVKNYFPEVYKVFKNYFVFGIVRNPYKRVISSYNEVFFRDFDDVMNGIKSFDSYKEEINSFIFNIRPEQIKGWTQSHRHFILQKHMFYIGRKSHFDLVIKLEEINRAPKVLSIFSESLASISETWVKRKNERQKGSIDLSIENVLTPSSITKIEQLYSEDFDLFGYNKISL